MKILGITGRSGSGKSYICEILKSLGAYIIDADKTGHKIIMKGQPAYNELVSEFGEDIIGADGEIVRRRLAEKAFSSQELTAKLNKITHRQIVADIMAELSASGAELAVIDAALLHESGLGGICSKTIAVVTDDTIRIERLKKRDGITEEEIRRRLKAQKPDEYYTNACDYTVDGTSCTKEELEKIIKSLGE